MINGKDGECHNKFWTQLHKKMAAPLFLFPVLTAGLFISHYLDQKLFDLFAFGGGYGSVPIMLNEVVGSKQRMDSKSIGTYPVKVAW